MKFSLESLQRNNSPARVWAGAAALLVTAALTGILLGATPLPVQRLAQLLLHWEPQSPDARILLYVRLPRVLGAMVCGAALAVSGAVIQGVLANRLASPSIIGVNAGAGLAATLCGALGIAGGWRLSLAAFLGAFAAVMGVSLGARKWGASRGTVILMGVAMNSVLGALSDAVVTLVPEISILRADFKVGSFSAVTYPKLIPAAVVILCSLAVLLTLCNELDVLSLGEETAGSLGMNTAAMRTLFLILAAALAGAAVSVCGLVSFVGLLIPHAVRRLTSGQARQLLPLSALFGAGFVTVCDTLSRVIFAPYELNVGILLSLMGAPCFLYVLFRGKGGHRHG